MSNYATYSDISSHLVFMLIVQNVQVCQSVIRRKLPDYMSEPGGKQKRPLKP